MVHKRDADGYWEWDPDDDGIYRRPVDEYVRPLQALLVRGRDLRLVVGAGYDPDAPISRRVGSRCRVELVPERGNPYDSNAVAIDYDGVRIGYLSAGEAARRQPGILKANAMGYHVLADGTVERIGREKTVRVALPHPDDFLRWLDKPLAQRADGYWPPVRLTLRGLDRYQQELLGAAGSQTRASLPGQLQPERVTAGKFAGAHEARVVVDGTVIGVVPAADLVDAPEVQRALRRGAVCCQVDLVRYPERVWAAVVID